MCRGAIPKRNVMKQVSFSESVVTEVRQFECFETHELFHDAKFYRPSDYRRFRCDELMNKIRKVEEKLSDIIIKNNINQTTELSLNEEVENKQDISLVEKDQSLSIKKEYIKRNVFPISPHGSSINNCIIMKGIKFAIEEEEREEEDKTKIIFDRKRLKGKIKGDRLLACPRRRISVNDIE